MDLEIIPNNPRGSGAFDATDETLGEAVQSVFDLADEQAELRWFDHRFSLGYKYDIGLMIDDIVALLAQVEKTHSGAARIEWASSSFPYSWTVGWGAGNLSVTMASRDPVAGEEFLRPGRMECDCHAFTASWRPLLRLVASRLRSAGYSAEYLARLDDICREDLG